jgi:plasmid maintenance system antidote protein VapI
MSKKNDNIELSLNARQILHTYLKKKKETNPNYSLRSLAKHLNVPSGRLSEILTQKRRITDTQLVKWLQNLGTQNELKKELSSLLKSLKKSVVISKEDIAILENDLHFAVLSLFETSNFKFDYDWIAERLNTSHDEIKLIFQNLEKVGLVIKNGSTYERCQRSVKTTQDIPSSALRQSVKKSILNGLDRIDSTDVCLRDISSITLAINTKKMHLAKKRIQKFRSDMAKILESGEQTEVYNLNIQLVPVTHLGPQKNPKRSDS